MHPNERVRWLRALLAFMALDVLLGLALLYRALEPRPVLVVPGVPESRVVLPGSVPPEAMKRFALLFLLNLDNFTPSTLEAQAEVAASLAAPAFLPKLLKSLEDRRAMVREGMLSSSFFPQPASVALDADRSTVTVRGRRRHTVGDRVSWEAEFEYVVYLEPAPPNESNPYGLAVRAVDVRKLDEGHE